MCVDNFYTHLLPTCWPLYVKLLRTWECRDLFVTVVSFPLNVFPGWGDC